MKNRWLYIALCFCILLFSLPILRVFFICLMMWYYKKHYNDKVGLLWIAILFVFSIIPTSTSMNKHTKVLQIQEVRTAYVIASNGKEKCILYNLKKGNLLDVVSVEGNYEKVNSQKNSNTFQFEKFLQRRNITTSMYVKSSQVIQQSNMPKAKLYRYIQNSKDKDTKKNLNALFYHWNDEKENLIFASGMHLSFLSILIAKYLHKKKEVCDILLSFLYYIFFPKTVFAVRIFFFSLVRILTKDYDKKDQLGISMIALLIYNPSFLYEISFQLPVLFRFVYLFDLHKITNKIKNFFVLFPYQLFVFHECYPLKILFFSFYRQIGGMCFLAAIITLPFPFFGFVFNFFSTIYKNMDIFFLKTYAVIGKPYFLWIVFWTIANLSILSFYSKKNICTFILLIIIQCNLSSFHPLGEVTFLDVGQGDTILIREPMNGEVALIDVAGKMGRNIAKERIYPYLKMKGIKKIDKVIITHDDYDHSGGIENLKKLVSIKKVIREKKSKIFMKKICLQNVVKKQYDDKNDNSIVLFARIARFNYLFMGDASKEVEQHILQTYNTLNCAVLKVGHHGSNTSTSKEFISQVNPTISIVSSGYKNLYGHPHKEVIDVLNKSHSKVFNTQEDGSVSIFFSPFFSFIKTGNGKISIME